MWLRQIFSLCLSTKSWKVQRRYGDKAKLIRPRLASLSGRVCSQPPCTDFVRRCLLHRTGVDLQTLFYELAFIYVSDELAVLNAHSRSIQREIPCIIFRKVYNLLYRWYFSSCSLMRLCRKIY